MRKRIKTICTVALAVVSALPGHAQLTLEECHELARQNYPLLKRYDLIERSTDYSLSNLNKNYLPQISLSGQATLQSDVMTLPETMQQMYAGSGRELKGLKKDQYRMALDVNQVLYDGGNVRAGKQAAKAEGEARARQTDVDMYALRERVNNLYFGILLLDERVQLNELLGELLQSNCRKLEAMQKGGIATAGDVDLLRAEYLGVRQQHEELTSTREGFRSMLALFIGREIDGGLTKPAAPAPLADEVLRPELHLFDARIHSAEARLKQLNAGLRPRLSLFAQGYYGYPGYNMFEDMFSHDLTLNGIVGVRLSWDIGRLYTYRDSKRTLTTSMSEIENAREVFLFNNRLQTTADRIAIDRYRKLMSADEEIVTLRTSIRRSAEARLAHGTISVNDLLQEITRENQARIEHSVHEIEMLKSIHELKHNLNQ